MTHFIINISKVAEGVPKRFHNSDNVEKYGKPKSSDGYGVGGDIVLLTCESVRGKDH